MRKQEIENPMVRERSTLDYFQQMILREYIAETYYKQKKPLTEIREGIIVFTTPSITQKGEKVNG